MQEESLHFEVIRINLIEPDIYTIELKATDEKELNYKAGQFLTFIFTINGKEVRRSFSLSSSPCFDEPLSITFKRVPNGEVTNFILRHIKVGDILYALSPAGLFTLGPPKENKSDLFLIAAGIGITPIYPMIRCGLQERVNDRFILIYSSQKVETTLYLKEIEQLQEDYPDRFICIMVFSREWGYKNTIRRHLNLGLLKQLVIENTKFSKEDSEFYACGPFAYMRMVSMILIPMGYRKEQIRKENFVVPKSNLQLWGLPIKDKSNKKVILQRGEEEIIFETAYSESILSAALRQGIKLPYSCQGGICSSCRQICIEGEVWMSENDVLTDKELNQGYILTCTGYAVSPEIRIKMT